KRKNILKQEISRRRFLSNITVVGTMAGFCGISCKDNSKPGKSTLRNSKLKNIHIKSIDANFEREALIRPFGFKGGYMREIWQSAAMLESDSGYREVGLCTQSVLWSDASVFASHSESGGNSIMFLLTEYALQKANGLTYKDPIELLEKILPDTYEYGKVITQNKNLRKTFVLNALVGVDNAAWILYAKENGFKTFDEMIPEPYRAGLSHRHNKIASIPLMAYSIPISEIKNAVDDGYFFMKIKIGQPGTQEEMLEKDKKRIEEIHKAIGNRETPHTKDGRIPYYFDANGRYQKKETLMKLLSHAEKIRALEQIKIIEEPFPEEYEIDVSDIGIRIAADESAHTDEDTAKRIQMGYSAIAVKAIAKTLSMTLKIIKVAHENGIPCFCADLTVIPILVDWNKNVAARLAPFPGLGLGLLETNGHQNYKRWKELVSYHPCAGASWMITENGVFNLSDDFYEKSGGIFMKSEHYYNLFHHKKK
ncbi:enolase C-terminal domain-like protein, partial [candidate division KSB1 bacterium]